MTGIIIVAAPRSGSTSLLQGIALQYDKRGIHEPDIIRRYPLYNTQKDVVKVIPFWHRRESDDIEETYFKILENIKKFDNIILLNRKNKIEQQESFYVRRNYKIWKGNWSDQKIYKDEPTPSEFEYTWDEVIEYYKFIDSIIERISKDLNQPIEYYEDIYSNKKLSHSDIKIYLPQLDESRRQRIV